MNRALLYTLTALAAVGAIYFFVIQLVAVAAGLLGLVLAIVLLRWFWGRRRS